MDQYKAGVEITQVQMQKVDPPPSVVDAFRDVQRAQADRERARNEAESYRNDIIPRARGESERLVQTAQGDKEAQIARSRGEAQRFLSVLSAYQQAQDVTMRRMYIETMEEILRRNPKILVDNNLQNLVPLLSLDGNQAAAPRPAPSAPGVSKPAAAAGALQSQRPREPPDEPPRGPGRRGRGRGAWSLASTLFTVQQTQQVLITQFGEPIRVIQRPGPARQDPAHPDRDHPRPALARLRPARRGDHPGRPAPVDHRQLRALLDHRPAALLPDGGHHRERGIRARLSSIMSSALRRVLGNEPLLVGALARPAADHGRDPRQVNDEARRFGIEVADVRLRRADLPEENTQAILSRMQSERERVAREIRAEGAEIGARVRAGADRERTVLLAEAQAAADITRGQGEQEAIRIFADAFGQDPQFFGFWRTMQAYREAFAEGENRLLLSPDNDFFRYFRNAPVAGGPPTSTGAPAAGGTNATGAAPAPDGAAAPSPAATPAPASPG